MRRKKKEADRDFMLACTCSRADHVVRFTQFESDGTLDDDFVYVNVVMAPGLGLWGRCKFLFRYLFGQPCSFINLAEVVLDRDSLHELQLWCRRAEKRMKAKDD